MFCEGGLIVSRGGAEGHKSPGPVVRFFCSRGAGADFFIPVVVWHKEFSVQTKKSERGKKWKMVSGAHMQKWTEKPFCLGRKKNVQKCKLWDIFQNLQKFILEFFSENFV